MICPILRFGLIPQEKSVKRVEQVLITSRFSSAVRKARLWQAECVYRGVCPPSDADKKAGGCFFAAERFLERQIDRARLSTNSASLATFLPPGMFQASDGQAEYLLFLGRLSPIKGIYPLLKACQLAPKPG